ncbi:MAG: class I SAM-dependent methyltransferase [Myxococcota bacterium]
MIAPTVASEVASEVGADAADAAYRGRVDECLRQAIADGVTTWSALLARAEGADPRLVATCLRSGGLTVSGMHVRSSRPASRSASRSTSRLALPPGSGPSSRWNPELHARDFEWYFTPRCARALAARAVAIGPRVLCMGTPTVAFALLDQNASLGDASLGDASLGDASLGDASLGDVSLGRTALARLTLVDRNPLVDRRHPGAGSIEHLTGDLAAVRVEAGLYDVAIFDAPWYPAVLQRWLAVAARAVRPGGRVLFALLPRLHRPLAMDDRSVTLCAARRLGRVEIEPGALRYESPLFETEALATTGLAVPPQWRRADLVQLWVEHVPPPIEPNEPSTSEPTWARFVIGPQVVHLDVDTTPEPGEILTPIDDRADFRYASISTREPRRAQINLWTSRSRVARVRRPGLVANLLERLAQAGDFRALDDAPALNALSPPARRRLLDALGLLLGTGE